MNAMPQQIAPPQAPVRTDEALESTLQAFLARHDPASDLYVFAHGPLMQNPGFDYRVKASAEVHGWHHAQGGSRSGLVFRIPAAKVRGELERLWRREMASGARDARWVTAWTGLRRVAAVAFET
jgi:cation transport protein ChaC